MYTASLQLIKSVCKCNQVTKEHTVTVQCHYFSDAMHVLQRYNNVICNINYTST